MGHEELKEIGINAYGHRHKLMKGIERLLGGQQGQSRSVQLQHLFQTVCSWLNKPQHTEVPYSSVCWCAFITGANQYLTFHCASQGTVLIDLAPDDKEFQSVEEEVRGESKSPDHIIKPYDSKMDSSVTESWLVQHSISSVLR